MTDESRAWTAFVSSAFAALTFTHKIQSFTTHNVDGLADVAERIARHLLGEREKRRLTGDQSDAWDTFASGSLPIAIFARPIIPSLSEWQAHESIARAAAERADRFLLSYGTMRERSR